MSKCISFRCWWAIGVFALSSLGSLHAELSWDSKPVETTVEAGSEPISHVFEIKNTGAKPVRIQRLQSDCPCVTLTNHEEMIAAGGTTRIEARFEVGDRIGNQRKRITVFTDDPRDSVVPLSWNIQIPEIIRIRPVFLHWKAGAEPLPQQAKAEVLLPGAKIKGWRLEKKGFRAEVREDSTGVLDIRVQPESASTPSQDRLLIELVNPDKTIRTYSLRLLIR
jgi:hypothetical protein